MYHYPHFTDEASEAPEGKEFAQDPSHQSPVTCDRLGRNMGCVEEHRNQFEDP